MSRLARILAFFSSMSFGLGLFAALALVSVAGSFLPTMAGAIYGSWWFATLLAVLVLNTGMCVQRQARGLPRGAARSRVLFTVHLSVLVIAVACAWAALSFRTEMVTLAEGESFPVGGQSWRLERVEVQHYADGQVSDWISTVSSPAGTQEIRVNQPAETGDFKILQSGYSLVYLASLEAGGETREIELAADTEVPLTVDGSVGFALSQPLAGLNPAVTQDQAAIPLADLLLTSHGRVLQRTAIFGGVPREIGDTGLQLTIRASSPRSGFLIRYSPGLPFVWLGLAMMGLSITVLMLMPRTKEATHA